MDRDRLTDELAAVLNNYLDDVGDDDIDTGDLAGNLVNRLVQLGLLDR
ncbi:hypothetical protein GCM10010218_63860 [Streptomyces mashuensis]|uniref:Uncharacterized protein n=1 Tax=Streptomyces mashuensis TaxID=33904 RepID=A0A919B9P4_9ACTN|nr:hypothetical protein [Streptomyces mashuensis]GHF73967.1 hypothetical protein GCM10010218_63860 [Streptomyces mashuensis]